MRLYAHVLNLDENGNRRVTARRSLMLDTVAQRNETEQVSDILIQNLSQTGLLMDASADFEISEIFYLHLPEIGATPAQIRWKKDNRYGCEFLAPVSQAIVSAALLRSAFELPKEEVQAAIEAKAREYRFFDQQLMPTDQKAEPATYIMSIAFAALLAAIIFVIASPNLILS